MWLLSSIFCSYGPRQLQLVKRLYAAPSVEPLPLVSTLELNNNRQQKTSSQTPSDTLVGEAEHKSAQNHGVEDNSMPFPCILKSCEKRFPTRASLKNHLKRVHKKQHPAEMPEVRLLKQSILWRLQVELICNRVQAPGVSIFRYINIHIDNILQF